MKHSRFSLFHPLWLAAALLAGLMLALTMTSAHALPDSPSDVPGGIEGTLYPPLGAAQIPVEGGWIDIHDAEGQPWMGTDTGPGGHFEISNLPPGMYILRGYPPPGSPYAASLPTEVQVLSGQWTSTTLHLTEVGISGYVRDCDATPEERIEGAWVVAHREDFEIWDSTDANGEFKLGGVTPGESYTLEALPPPGSGYVPLEPITVVPITTGVVLELCIPPTSVVGIVRDPAGAPVPGAWAVVWNEFHWDETGTDELGNFLFRGMPPGEFKLHVGPPWDDPRGLIAIDPFIITVTIPPTVTDVGVITLPQAFKTVIGHVFLAGTSDGAPNAEVHARRLDRPGFAGAMVEPTGAFTMSLTGGEWHIGVRPATWPVTWIFPGPPAWVVFDQDTTPQTETVTLEVIPTNAEVTGQVVCPGGPCPGGLYWDIRVELRSDEIGNGAGLGSDYRFAIPIPDGWYELVVHVAHPELQGPEPIPVFVGPGGHYDVGDIVLLHKNATIMGQVRNQLGHGVEGVSVGGWQPEGFGWGWAETDANGVYTMPVIPGEWFVEPHPGPEMPYVYRHRPRLVHVAPDGTMEGVDFTLTSAGARIEGIAVDANDPMSERLWGLDGWAWAERADTLEFFSDAPMWDGGFELKVRGGYTYYVGLNLPPHAPFVSGSTGPVEVPPAGRVPITVPLEHKNARIEGQMVIAGTTTPAFGVWGEVFGEDEAGHWGGVRVDPASAWYELPVVSGTWHLRAWVDPASGYVAVPTTTLVAAQSGPPTRQDFEVWPIGSSISGRVFQPDGTTPQQGAFVFAEGESLFVGYFEAHAETDVNGDFELLVPEGEYVVGAALPGEELEKQGWLNPPPIEGVVVSAASPATGQDLRFRRLDGVITGTVRFSLGTGITPTHPAYVWGWAESGERAETKARVVSGTKFFTYTMRVVSDTIWHVGAVYDDWDNGYFYESPEEVVDLTTTDQATQHLVLGGPQSLPQPFIVSFDASQMQTIVMPDGTELSIPPGALVVSGTVTLYIFPTKALRPEPGQELIGAGYEIWATNQNGQEITQFNQNVVMTFQYLSDAELAAQGISEHLLVPVYYSTLVGHWILADSYVVDTVNNEITLQLDHFTRFGVMSTEPAASTVYLPLVFRDFGS